MPSLNKAIIIGHLGRDAELSQTQSGTAVAKFSVATTKYRKDKDPMTEWHNMVAYGRTAEFCGRLKKGDLVYVEGELWTQSWEKDGHKNYMTSIVVNEVKFFTKSEKAETKTSGYEEELPF